MKKKQWYNMAGEKVLTPVNNYKRKLIKKEKLKEGGIQCTFVIFKKDGTIDCPEKDKTLFNEIMANGIKINPELYNEKET